MPAPRTAIFIDISSNILALNKLRPIYRKKRGSQAGIYFPNAQLLQVHPKKIVDIFRSISFIAAVYKMFSLGGLMNFKGTSFISIRDQSRERLLYLLDKSQEVKDGKLSGFLTGKIVASLFFEPSTRTRLSFESAIQQQGGRVIGFSSASTSSVRKGETLSDTIRTVNGYCDAIVMRHTIEGGARLAAETVDIPIINAGDGANQHPTQTALDLFTIREKKGKLDGLKIGMMGDLKYGRTVHSLATAFQFFQSELIFIAPPELQMPKHYLEELDAHNVPYRLFEHFEECGKELDILYVTRIQRERFPDQMEYERVAGSYRIDKQALQFLGKETYIMHPLPRVDEIAPEIDSDPRSIYFEQAYNGIPVREALLGLLLGTIS